MPYATKTLSLMITVTTLTGMVTARDLPAEQLTPAQQKIEWAAAAIDEDPDAYQNHNRLALAYTQRARETANSDYYDRALDALDVSFDLAPNNFQARKLVVWAQLGQHEFAKALEGATELQRIAPDDLLVYGLLTDAHIELGNYAEAEEAAQWMLNLRPGNIPGLTRAAYLRELFGDIDGAIDLMATAYPAIQRRETEDRAWTLTHLAHLELERGRNERAETMLAEALALFPDYHYALANLAKVRTAQGRLSEAVELLRKRYAIAPHPENLYELAVALERSGGSDEAAPLFESFVANALAESKGWDNANRELIAYLVDVDPAQALSIARREIDRRSDVFTLDAYAWALH